MDSIITQCPSSKDEFMSAFSSLLAEEREMIGSAYAFSQAGHFNEKRESGEPYFNHPKAVAWILVAELELFNWQCIVGALLHDIRENTFLLSHMRIILNFGLEVGLDVDALTHRKGESVEAYVHRVMTQGIRTILIKLCDRLHNMRTLGSMPRDNQVEKVRETRLLYLPLADQLATMLPQNESWKAVYLRNELEAQCEKFA